MTSFEQMEKVFTDTSAFYALLDRSDRYHKQASALWPDLLEDDISLVTTNYIVWETTGLLQHRIGFEAARLWSRDILAVLDIIWVDEAIDQRANDLWYNLGRLNVSLTDCVSFVVMHHFGIESAFCFKQHFEEHGFSLVSREQRVEKLKAES